MALKKSVIIGGGAAGFFAAINCATSGKNQVIILEKNNQLLTKVRISGGGRCNVTHRCFDPKELVKNYPRGQKELLGPFHHFQPLDTIDWFAQRNVTLKAEEDGRMFPSTDKSETIINCLLEEASKYHVEIETQANVTAIEKVDSQFIIHYNETHLVADQVLLASGGNAKTYQLAESLGHRIVPPVPSLFTFNVPDSPLNDLAGIAVANTIVSLPHANLKQQGPLLITHWGFSGPAVLKLSAWGARWLHEKDYQTQICINWLPEFTEDEIHAHLLRARQYSKKIGSEQLFPLPKNLWLRLLYLSEIREDAHFATLTKQQLEKLKQNLSSYSCSLNGKTTYKQEFVTSGGVAVEEVNFKTMESRLCPNLFFAGEILNIDGITGGFNFQNAWTTGWLAAQSMINKSV